MQHVSLIIKKAALPKIREFQTYLHIADAIRRLVTLEILFQSFLVIEFGLERAGSLVCSLTSSWESCVLEQLAC